jgi:hypothetical protein
MHVRVQEISLPIDKLKAAPADELHFFLLGGHLSNEITILTKLAAFATGFPVKPQVTARAGATQTALLVRLLFGKLFDGWKLVEERFNKRTYSAKYLKEMPADSVEALGKLKLLFRQPGTRIKKIRDNLSFYNCDEKNIVLGAFHDLNEDLHIYLSDDAGNTLYYASELSIIRAIVELYKPASFEDSMDKFIKEATTTGSLLLKFLDGYFQVFIERHIAKVYEDLKPKTRTVRATNFKRAAIPYFTRR